MKHHEIESRVQEITGLGPFGENGAVSVLVTGDHPEMVPVVREKLAQAGLSATEKGGRRFKGRQFFIALRNVGDAFRADWEFA